MNTATLTSIQATNREQYFISTIAKIRRKADGLRHRLYYRESLSSPSRRYWHPSEVLFDPKLTKVEIRNVLMSWRSEALQLRIAESEGLDGGERRP